MADRDETNPAGALPALPLVEPTFENGPIFPEKEPRRYTEAQQEWAGANLNPRNRGKARPVDPGPLTDRERAELVELLGLPPEEDDHA